MHTNEVIWHGENVKTRWDASYRYCIARKVICNEFTAGGRSEFFLDSVCKLQVCQTLDEFPVPVYTMKLQQTLQNFCLVKLVKFVLTMWRAKGDCIWLLQQ